MKNKFLVAIFWLISNTTFGQITTSFTTDKDKFPKAISDFMSVNKLDNCIQASEAFSAAVKSGEINPQMLDKTIEVANIMAARLMPPNPHFVNFLNAVVGFAKVKGTPAQFNDWAAACLTIAQGSKKGDNKDYSKFMDFSSSYFGKGALAISSSKTWKVASTDYKLIMDEKKPRINFPYTKFFGYVNGDTVSINNTTGDYYPLENKWSAKGGLIDWTRSGVSNSEAFAAIKKPYTISLDNFSYTIDSVDFVYTELFGKTVLKGKLTDKLVPDNDSSKSSYPRFASYDNNLTIKEIAPNVSYTGAFNLQGNKVMGGSSDNSYAELTFYKNDKVTKALTVLADRVTIKKGEELSTPKAQVIIFNGKDTIYHPELNMIYKIKQRELKLIRGKNAQSRSKFIDTYHNHEFEADAIFWNLDSTRMRLTTIEGKGQAGSSFESNNYFSKDRMRKIQGSANYDPLSIIRKQFDSQKTRELDAAALAKAIDPSLSEEQTKTLYYELVSQGFIKYDEARGVVIMRDKVVNYVMANAKKIDFDILRIKSIPKDGIDYIDLSNNNIELKGVQSVAFSDTAKVEAFPLNNFLKLQKDRNMEFNGTVYAGRMDLFGNKFKFNYGPFAFDLDHLDSMRINIPVGTKTDVNGDPVLATLKTNIDVISGLLEIDAPINKSGRARLLQFPKLTSRENSYAFYSDVNIAGGAYKRKDFYFELQPFKIDSLNTFTPSVINWDGTLKSGGILPDIKEKLKIQDDLSLGFTTQSPATGWDNYKGGGNYKGEITLDYRGLTGKGSISHLSSKFESKQIQFYLDSMNALTDTFAIAKTMDGVKTPSVNTGKSAVHWLPKKDEMSIANTEGNAFKMYEDQTSLKGKLMLTSKGLKGSGALDWKEALIGSKEFNFKTDDMSADTAEMKIKSIAGDKVTFNTPNVQAKIDFKNKLGDFKSNLPNNPTDFAYNQYKTDLSEFKWDIEKKILDFKAQAGKPATFTSLRPSQLGLNYKGQRATYNLGTSELKIEQVEEIRVADAIVKPANGEVIVRGEAVIDQLKNAVILADSTTRKYKIENCTLDIISKAELKGSGKSNFTTKDHANQPITFGDISCKKETFGLKKKDQYDDFSLVAKGNIEAKENFFIYPNVNYYGDVNLFGRNDFFFMKGHAKINFKNPNTKHAEFSVVDDINPDKLFLHVDSATKSSEGGRTVTGIFADKSLESSSLYTTILGSKQNADDKPLVSVQGVVTHNATSGEYIIGDENRIVNGGAKGTILKYNDEKGMVKGDGILSLGTDFGVIKTLVAGEFENDLTKKDYKFNLTLGLDMKTENKAVSEKLETILYNDNVDLPEIDYGKDKFKNAWANLIDPKADDKILKEMEVTGVPKRIKALSQYLVLTDLNMVYDPVDMTLRSFSKIGIMFVGEKGIHKKCDGYVEIGLRQNADYFNIYLKTGNNEWFYFEYKPGILGLVSSYDEFNRTVGAVSPDKRKVTGENNKFYTYTIASTINKSAFVDAMKEKVNPLLPQEKLIYKPKPAPKDSVSKAVPVKTEVPKTEEKKVSPTTEPIKETPKVEEKKTDAPKTETAPKEEKKNTPETPKIEEKKGEDSNAPKEEEGKKKKEKKKKEKDKAKEDAPDQ